MLYYLDPSYYLGHIEKILWDSGEVKKKMYLVILTPPPHPHRTWLFPHSWTEWVTSLFLILFLQLSHQTDHWGKGTHAPLGSAYLSNSVCWYLIQMSSSAPSSNCVIFLIHPLVSCSSPSMGGLFVAHAYIRLVSSVALPLRILLPINRELNYFCA